MNEAPQTSVLVVDDDDEIRELVGNFLKQHQFNVLLAEDGPSMFACLARTTLEIDCIILDVMMPGDDGFALCRQLRATSHTPIIMLTAVTDDMDKIVGLELGADDYLTKPFNPRELLARIKAVLRRSSQQALSTNPLEQLAITSTKYIFADWHLEKESRNFISPDNIEISLSSGEFDLLLALVENPNRVLNRDQLLDITRNRTAAPFDRSVDIQISRLRQKIEANPKKPKLIKTVRGGGYMFTPKVQVINE